MARMPVEIDDAIVAAHAQECAARARLLAEIAAYDATEAWRDDGARSMTDWLAMRLDVDHRQAAELERVAGALVDLPCLAGAFADGVISWDQLRHLTRHATPDTDADLAEEAAGLSLAGVRARARAARRRDPSDDAADHDRQRLHLRRRGNRLRIFGEFSGDDADRVEQTIVDLASDLPRDPITGAYDLFERRCATALAGLCSTRVPDDADTNPATVVLHVDLDILASARPGVADLEFGSAVSSETARRIACDCRLEEVIEYGGIPLGKGRTTRTIPPWLRRQLAHRDRGCRFPGCSSRRWLHAHHILHWAQGGPTDLGNLVLLCTHHHRFVHEHDWTIHGNPTRELTFTSPTGRQPATRPPTPRPLQPVA